MQMRNWEDFVQFDADGRLVQTTATDYGGALEARLGDVLAQGSVIDSHPGGVLAGSLGTEQGDFIGIQMVAGQTYTFSYRGTGSGGIVDPYLALFGVDGAYITEDDDGGFGRTSQITYTATEDGTHYLLASSWYHLDPSAPGYPTADTGDYTIAVWSPQAGHDAGNTFATAGSINLGTNYEYLETAGDDDVYSIQLTAGMVYTFTYSGGIASETVDPGESIGVLGLYNSEGDNVSDGLWYNSRGETSITFVAQESGTYYLEALGSDNFFGGTPMVGGYTIDVTAARLEDMDPLEALRWDSAANIDTVDVGGVPTAYVYFGEAGETFGENLPQGTSGWTVAQQQAVMNVLQNEYTPITGIQYLVTTDVSQAEFRLLTVPTATYGARFYPQDPAYGTQEGIGTFNLASGGFSYDASLVEGGFSYAVVMHEFGHAHGIAHPHDTGGGSEVMLGVTASRGSLGIYDLNQGVYTVMSYNDAWQLHPDGPSQLYLDTLDRGWSASLSAFDIAVLQERYGAHDYNTGDNVYMLTDNVAEGAYETIWDTGGTDSIAYGGTLDARIDLTAATLDYSPTGGGVISFLYNDPAAVATTHPALLLHGGFTIANGVVIENATGGSGNDVLIGNAAGNVLTGNAGNDALIGRDGIDTVSYINASGAVRVDLAAGTASGADGNDTLETVENILGSSFDDVLIGDSGVNTISGGLGNDVVRGDGGDDVLDGGAGHDVLFGGDGADIFAFTVAENGDRIRDFVSGTDRIDLSAFNIGGGDVRIAGNNLFVDTDGLRGWDLHVVVQGDTVQLSDIIFAADEYPGAAAAAILGAGVGGGDYMIA